MGAQILVDLGLKKLRLMTNNPAKIVALEGYGLEVVERVPIVVVPNEFNRAYLRTKQEKMGHLLERAPIRRLRPETGTKINPLSPLRGKAGKGYTIGKDNLEGGSS